MIPEPAVLLILNHLESEPRTKTYIKIAQISRDFRRYALSDMFWSKFDVHEVKGSPNNLYEYGGYFLTGIAAHYFNYLASLTPGPRREIHLASPRNLCLKDLDVGELYDQMILAAAEFGGRYWSGSRYVRLGSRPFHRVERRVWELQLGYPPENHHKWFVPSYKVPGNTEVPFHAHLSSNFSIHPSFEDDWDVNLLCARAGKIRKCSTKLVKSIRFRVEVVRYEFWHFGRGHYFKEPAFIAAALDVIPGLFDHIKQNYARVHTTIGPEEGFESLYPEWVYRDADFMFEAVAHCGRMLERTSGGWPLAEARAGLRFLFKRLWENNEVAMVMSRIDQHGRDDLEAADRDSFREEPQLFVYTLAFRVFLAELGL